MTSYTSDRTSRQALKTAFVYLVATAFCALFGAVYELFSHEVYSYFMIYAFAIPLLLGAMPNLAAALFGWRVPHRLAANVWNSGVATLTVGCIFKGALDIFGTTNQLFIVYPVAAIALLAMGIVLHVAARPKRAEVKQSAARIPLFGRRAGAPEPPAPATGKTSEWASVA